MPCICYPFGYVQRLSLPKSETMDNLHDSFNFILLESGHWYYKVILGDFFPWSSGPFFGEEHINRIIELMSSCTGSFTETQLGEVRFPEISAPILEKVCQYFYWSLQFARLVSCFNSLAFGVVKLCTFGLGARGGGGGAGCCVGVYD